MKLSDVDKLVDALADPESAAMQNVAFDPEIAHSFLESLVLLTEKGIPSRTLAFAVTNRHTHQAIGMIYLCPYEPGLAGEIHYAIHKKFWGQGFATEALKKIIEFSFNELGLAQLDASVTSTNVGSQKVLEKTGFLFTGELVSAENDASALRKDDVYKTYRLTASSTPTVP